MTSAYRTALNPPPPVAMPDAVSHEGGAVYAADSWTRLKRVLILGADTSTFYVGKTQHASDALALVDSCLDEDQARVLSMVREVNSRNLAPKVDHALFVLAAAVRHDYGSPEANKKKRALAYAEARKACRTFSHLSMFNAFRGGIPGDGMKRMVAKWFTDQSSKQLAYGAIKYQTRNGWAQRDAIVLSRPKPHTQGQSLVLQYIVTGKLVDYRVALEARAEDTISQEDFDALSLISGVEAIKTPDVSEFGIAQEIQRYDLPRESVPTKYLNSVIVWDALLHNMPYTALIRNLNKLTAVGVFDRKDRLDHAINMILSVEKIRGSRVHPMTILLAARQYAQGHGERGKLTWKPNVHIINALDTAFRVAFQNVTPTGKNILLAVDTSSSMDYHHMLSTNMTAREVAAAMALVIDAVEPNTKIIGFNEQVTEFPQGFSGKRVSDVVDWMDSQPNGGTLCRLPLDFAQHHSMNPDAIVMFTDEETMDIGSSFMTRLRDYRNRVNKHVRLVVVALVANDIHLFDPSDPLSLGVVGFDASAPALISEFINGSL